MGRVLILAHRRELIKQAVGHCRGVGLTASMEMGQKRAGDTDVVVSTIQTLNSFLACDWCLGVGEDDCEKCRNSGRVYRMTSLDPREFDAIIIDEAHHSAAKSYRRVIKYFQKHNPSIRVLGVTATPQRGDGLGLHNVFDSVAYEMDLADGISNGWLCPVQTQFIHCDHLDMSQVKTKRGGDLADGDLERAFLPGGEDEDKLLAEIVFPTVRIAAGRSVIFFAPGVEAADKYAASFRSHGVTAEVIVGATLEIERDRIVERFKSGETQVLVNVAVCTEGFDAPATHIVASARPTKSKSMFLQILGRGTRPLPGIVDGPETPERRREAIAKSDKPYCLHVEFTGDSGAHKLVTVADVLAGDLCDADVSLAVEQAKQSGEAVDLVELAEKAKQAREEAEERAKQKELERQQKLTRHYAEQGSYTAEDVDIFSGRTFDAYSDYTPPSPEAATQKQVAYLVKLGVRPETAIGYSKGQAGQVITSYKQRTGGDFVVTFGKHKGTAIKDLPGGYRRWARENIPQLREHIEIYENQPVTGGAVLSKAKTPRCPKCNATKRERICWSCGYGMTKAEIAAKRKERVESFRQKLGTNKPR